MRQSQSRGGFDSLGEMENYQSFSNQRLQNFSNSKFSNPSTGIKISNSNKQSTSQTKSKIAKKSDRSIDQARQPLNPKTSNKQANPKKKTQEAKRFGVVLQKVDYDQQETQASKKSVVIDSQSQSPKVEKEPNTSKSTALKSSTKTNGTSNENKTCKFNKSPPETNNRNDLESDDNLQLIKSKFSKFLQEKINSHQHLKIMPIEKSQKTVSFKQPIINNEREQSFKVTSNQKRPKLRQSSIQSIERPEIEVEACPKKDGPCIQKQIIDSNMNDKQPIKNELHSIAPNKQNKISKDSNLTPQRRRRSDFDSYSETDSEDDSIDDFHSIEPKVPPKPIEHLVFENKDAPRTSNNRRNVKNEEEDKNDNQFKELIKQKNELYERIYNTIQLQKQPEIEINHHFKTKSSREIFNDHTIDDENIIMNDSLIPRIDQIQNSLNSSSLSTTNSSNLKNQTPKISNSKNETRESSDSNLIPNCNQLNPSSFVPKRRNFKMDESDSEADYENDLKSNLKSDTSSEKNSINKSPVLLEKINKSKSEPRSPHVTWDISNCPPIRPKVSNGFGISKSFSFIDYDKMNGYSEEKETDQLTSNDNNEIDYNSPTNFSRAMKLPKSFLNEFNPDLYNDDDNDKNLLYDNYENEEEDTSENIPNYSRILSILNKKLNESQYNEVLDIMNTYKAKHFCLLISMHGHVEALYLLRSDLSYAKILWGEGLTKVSKEDVSKFFSINIASRRFEPMKISDFACDVDAFTVDL